MFKIIYKRVLNPMVTWMDIEAPLVARKAKAGQFIILRVNESGERIPFTIAKCDAEKGSVTIIFQKVGGTTKLLDTLEEGDFILDFVGPLGRASEVEGFSRVAVVGGGVGCAIAYPEARALRDAGAHVDMIAGFRNTDILMLEEEMASVSDRLFVMTDDGSNGNKGFVTVKLKELLDAGEKYDLVVAIGPLPMMRAVSDLTKEYGIKTIVSMNPIMIDGTGMCGGCRLTVGGEVKFACVDGPEFDAHLIDWDEAMKRLPQYRQEEKNCRLMNQ
ncbi:MAG: sulfide/dihydroorotate dehydrogenase-like FAD/NAD-binding protein [Oscillospiraceae bacterium]|nr:sulfide/dihydroorotate dehydrogenase-like FAD/NAD-binding protein [Oscillospiraceae bacterium]MDD3833407.1 sulfide/dihydroorotate dehydrogenase-like FAD/NAD-binding protein [Oscillospiraceae bacterium]MDD4547064.1 sulfide/dihydroorotate dehydrogenase-like FAD/NAD-binding protein [Oscillospiraceae bacterium]